MGEMRNLYKISVGKLEGKRPRGRIHEDGKIILDLREMRWEGVD
jgi:hypothetical protein